MLYKNNTQGTLILGGLKLKVGQVFDPQGKSIPEDTWKFAVEHKLVVKVDEESVDEKKEDGEVVVIKEESLSKETSIEEDEDEIIKAVKEEVEVRSFNASKTFFNDNEEVKRSRKKRNKEEE